MNSHFQQVRKSVFSTAMAAVLVVSSLMGALSLVPGLPSIAQASGGSGDNGDKKITLCHATGDDKHPYVEITVSYKEGGSHGHEGHSGDIIPAPAGGCPAANDPPPTIESTSPPPTNPPPTAVPPTATQVWHENPTATPITSASQPTNTPTSQPTNTALPQPTNTPLPQPTNTPLPPPTATPLPTPTYTPQPLPTATPRPGCYVFGSSDVPKAIPDPGNVASVLVLPSPGLTITSLDVRVDHLLHTFDRDLQIGLVAPDGTSFLIADQVGDNGHNFLGTMLLDGSLLPIVQGVAPFTGNFSPDNPLSQLNNKNSAGTWKLNVVDMSAGDSGILNAWSLEVCGTPVKINSPASNQALKSSK